MKNIIFTVIVIAMLGSRSIAQENVDFQIFVKTQKTLMLRAYAKRDVSSYVAHLNEIKEACDQLEGREKEFSFSIYLQNEYYLLADLYARVGDKAHALEYLELSKNYDYDDLSSDHDLDILKNEPRYIAFVDSASKGYRTRPGQSNAASFSTHVQADYDAVIASFMRYYNLNEVDSVRALFSGIWGEDRKSIWKKTENESLKNVYGDMHSYKYLGRSINGDEHVALFKVVFDRSVHVMGVSLDKDNKMETFRFETSSPYIDKLLAREM